MITGIADTTVALHVFRKYAPAREWLDSQATPPGFTSISWLEVMYGAPGKTGQAQSKIILSRFEFVYLMQVDQEWAMQQVELLRLSHGVSINDCLIASVAHRLQVPLYTHNLKHMQVLLGDTLPQKPY